MRGVSFSALAQQTVASVGGDLFRSVPYKVSSCAIKGVKRVLFSVKQTPTPIQAAMEEAADAR